MNYICLFIYRLLNAIFFNNNRYSIINILNYHHFILYNNNNNNNNEIKVSVFYDSFNEKCLHFSYSTFFFY
jgi:hypothetical protein